MRVYHWFWDLDGVLADFDQHMDRLWPERPSVVTNARTEHLTEDARHTKRATYDRLAACDGFYAQLPWVPGMREVWTAFQQQVAPQHSWVLSAVPSFRHRPDAEVLMVRSTAEKQRWVAAELAPHVAPERSLIVRGSEQKIRHVTPVGVLIDDRPENIADWEQHGGIGVLHESPEATLREIRRLVTARGSVARTGVASGPRTR